MSGKPEHPDPRGPNGAGGIPAGKPSDEVLVDWIDGNLTDAAIARMAVVYPELDRMVRAMRRDAMTLRAAAGETAPADLAARITAQLRAEAEQVILLGGPTASGSLAFESPAEPAYAGMRTHNVDERRAIDWRRYRPAFAAAASLALLASGVVVVNTIRNGGSNTSPSGTNIATLSTTDNTVSADVGGSRLAASDGSATGDSAIDPATRVADAASPTGSDAATLAEDSGVAAAGLAAVEAPVRVATGRVPDAMTAEQALELARDQRLVIRVYANDAKAIARAETGRDADGSVSYRLSKRVPSRVIAAVAPPIETTVWPEPELHPRREAAIASDSGRQSGRLSVELPNSAHAALPPDTFSSFVPQTRTYLADLRGTAESLSTMQTALETQLKGTAEFEVLDEPLALQLPADPGSVLWWTQSPAEWASRFVVPVVIEDR